MDDQIKKMLFAESESFRQARIMGMDYPWKSPVFCIAFGLGKLSRVIWWDRDDIRVARIAPVNLAEELREAAHYLLRAAHLVENPDSKETDSKETNSKIKEDSLDDQI